MRIIFNHIFICSLFSFLFMILLFFSSGEQRENNERWKFGRSYGKTFEDTSFITLLYRHHHKNIISCIGIITKTPKYCWKSFSPCLASSPLSHYITIIFTILLVWTQCTHPPFVNLAKKRRWSNILTKISNFSTCAALKSDGFSKWAKNRSFS